MSTTLSTTGADLGVVPGTGTGTSNPPTTSLYNLIQVPSGLKYTIGHRTVTLMAYGASATSSLCRGIPIYLAQGDLAPGQTLIYAEEVYLQAGGSYVFPAGSTLRIVARKIAVLGDGDATISIRGDDRSQLEWPTDLVPLLLPPGQAGQRVSRYGDPGGYWACHGKNGQDGYWAVNGVKAFTGGDAGNVAIYTHEIDKNIRFDLVGGKGMDGQRGADGGKGGDGVVVTKADNEQVQRGQFRPPPESGSGGDGGWGGTGGAGGRGGSFHLVYFGRDWEKVAVTGDLHRPGKGGAGPLVLCRGGVGGAAGEGGEGDRAGKGAHIDYIEYDWKWSAVDKTRIMYKTADGHYEGPRGTDGVRGKRNLDGKPGADGSMSQGAHIMMYVIALEANPYDPAQLSMVLQRLQFEYLVCFTAEDDDTSDDERVADFRASWEWVREILEGMTTGNPFFDVQFGPRAGSPADSLDVRARRAGFQAAIKQYLSLRQCIDNHVDVYGNTLRRVPEVSLVLDSLDQSLDTFRQMEALYRDVLQASVIDRATQMQLEHATKMLQKQRPDLTSLAGSQVDEMESTLLGMPEKDEHLMRCREAVLRASKHLKAGIEAKLGCSVDRILSALGMVLMFADPSKVGLGRAVFAAGGAMSVAGAIDMDKITGPTGAQVEKKYLLHKIFSDTGYDNRALDEHIKMSYDTDGLLAIDGGDKYKLVVAAQADFEQMCDQYLPGVAEAAEAREALDAYVAAVQDVNASILLFNQQYLGYSDTLLQMSRAKSQQDALASEAVNVTNDQLALLMAFYSGAYERAKMRAIQAIYNASRVVYALTLKPSSVFSKLAELGSAGEIDAQSLWVAYNDKIGEDLNRHLNQVRVRAMSIDNPGDPPLTVVFNARTFPSALASVRATGRCTFVFTPSIARGMFGLSAGKADIRLLSVGVVMRGVKKLQRGPLGNDRSVMVSLQSSGSITVEDPEDGRAHQFDGPKVTVSSTFDCGDDESGSPSRILNWVDLGAASVYFGSRAQPTVRELRLLSPFTAWSISVLDLRRLDLSGLTSVEISFQCQYRTVNPGVTLGKRAGAASETVPAVATAKAEAAPKPKVLRISGISLVPKAKEPVLVDKPFPPLRKPVIRVPHDEDGKENTSSSQDTPVRIQITPPGNSNLLGHRFAPGGPTGGYVSFARDLMRATGFFQVGPPEFTRQAIRTVQSGSPSALSLYQNMVANPDESIRRHLEVLSLLKKNISQGQNVSFTGAVDPSADGHVVVTGGAIYQPGAAEMGNLHETVSRFSAMSAHTMAMGGGLVQPPQYAAFLRLDSAWAREEFLTQHRQTFAEQLRDHHAADLSLEGQILVVGGGVNFVEGVAHRIVHTETTVTQLLLVKTLGYHIFSRGAAQWSMQVDKALDGTLLYTSVHAGRNQLPGMDAINARAVHLGARALAHATPYVDAHLRSSGSVQGIGQLLLRAGPEVFLGHKLFSQPIVLAGEVQTKLDVYNTYRQGQESKLLSYADAMAFLEGVDTGAARAVWDRLPSTREPPGVYVQNPTGVEPVNLHAPVLGSSIESMADGVLSEGDSRTFRENAVEYRNMLFTSENVRGVIAAAEPHIKADLTTRFDAAELQSHAEEVARIVTATGEGTIAAAEKLAELSVALGEALEATVDPSVTLSESERRAFRALSDLYIAEVCNPVLGERDSLLEQTVKQLMSDRLASTAKQEADGLQEKVEAEQRRMEAATRDLRVQEAIAADGKAEDQTRKLQKMQENLERQEKELKDLRETADAARRKSLELQKEAAELRRAREQAEKKVGEGGKM